MGEVIRFTPTPTPDPKLVEAVETARQMAGGNKCANPGCTYDGVGCSQEGCLLYSSKAG